MSSERLAASIAALRIAFPHRAFTDETVALYGRMLADLDGNAVARAVERLLNRDDFLPTIAAIKREVAEEALGLPSPEQAWDLAVEGRLRGVPPELRQAVESVGGRWAILHSDNLHVVRSQFLKSYGERRRNAVETFVGGRASPDMPQLGSTMATLPETETFAPRPVHARWLRRAKGQPVGEITEAEKQHAVELLRAAPDGDPDPIYREAELVFMEAGQ